MKIAKVKIHCPMCGKFKVEHEVDTNEYGYFSFPEAYCPHCLAILGVVIDCLPKDINDG